jgi:tyrosine-protein kinase Etk/Wzc
MAPNMGTLLLVARADSSEMGELVESAKRLAHVGAAFHGVVFNAVDTSRRQHRSYGYGYYGYAPATTTRSEPHYALDTADTVMPKRIEPEHATS